jgi:hypothetical protein
MAPEFPNVLARICDPCHNTWHQLQIGASFSGYASAGVPDYAVASFPEYAGADL